MDQISVDDLEALAIGGQVLGSGGGGRSEDLVSITAQLLSQTGPVSVGQPTHFPTDVWCLPVAMVGASTLRSERLLTGGEPEALVAEAARQVGSPIGAIAWLEAAGSNLIIPIWVAAMTGLPLVDADGMGRAFSDITRTVYEVSGTSAAPVVLAGPAGDVLTVRATSDRLEDLVRPAVTSMGGWAIAGWYAQQIASVRTGAIHGTWRRALSLGRSLISAGAPQLSLPHSKTLVRGYISSVEPDGPTGRSVVITSSTKNPQDLRLVCRDECLLALLEGQVVASTPEIICVLSTELHRALNVEDLRVGRHVQVVTLPAAPAWHEPTARVTVDAAAHGLWRSTTTPHPPPVTSTVTKLPTPQ